MKPTAPHCVLALALAALLLSFVALAPAAQPYDPVYGDPLLETWRWRTFPDLSGFSAEAIGEADNGDMWVGSGDTMWHYDGLTWTQVALPENGSIGAVATFCRTKDGTLYAGGRRGMLRLNRDGKWTYFLAPHSKGVGELKKLTAGRDGSLWAATSLGPLRFKDEKWTLFTGQLQEDQLKRLSKLPVQLRKLPNSVFEKRRTAQTSTQPYDLYDIAEGPDGRIWMANEAGEILSYDPKADADPVAADAADASAPAAWAVYNNTDGIASGRLASILLAQDGTVWVVYSAGSSQLNAFDGTTWTTQKLSELGLPEDGGTLLQTRDGVIWLSGRYAVYTRRNGRWRRYERPEVPIPTARNFLYQSTDGALWIGGPGTEIDRIDYQTEKWLTLKDLNFHWESASGAEWFLHRSGRVVVHDGPQWTSYGPEDGVIDAPVALLGTRSGEVWVAGSHEHVAATARFDGKSWQRTVHSELSWGIEYRGMIESADGSLWFAATVDSSGPKQHRAGLLQYRDGRFIHHHQPGRAPSNADDSDPATLLPATQRPEPIGKFLVLGNSKDGRIWAARNIIVYRDQAAWRIFSPPKDLRFGVIESALTTRAGELWFGSRQFGALQYDGSTWRQHQGKDSLVANSVRSLAQTADGTLWAATDRDVSRYDGATWMSDRLPAAMNIPQESGILKAAASGRLWVNRFAPEWNRRAWPKSAPIDLTRCDFWTWRHQFVATPPETTIIAANKRVPPPGNLSVFWSAVSRWGDAKSAPMQFSYRLDGGAWSTYTAEHGHSFFELPPGLHRIEVRARDGGFNADPTPAVFEVEVLPVVWRQGWFLVLMFFFNIVLFTLAIRVLLERRRLKKANISLAQEVVERKRAEEALRELNQELDARVTSRTVQLQAANKELEAFSYSVSHDLRAPLRAIDGFSKALLEDYSDKLDEEGRDSLQRVRAGAQKMDKLIDDMFSLARVTRDEMHVGIVDLSAIVREIAADLQTQDPTRQVDFVIAPNLVVSGDARFLRVALVNLVGNAWKFTSKRVGPRIEFGVTESEGERAYFVRDNGAGFDMQHANRLFSAFRRIHSDAEFPGTGIGLATVRRIILRHGGRTWAEAKVNEGATIYFTLPLQVKASAPEGTAPPIV